jgi:septal ring factor EnvC (AmiA/AmiB activator)
MLSIDRRYQNALELQNAIRSTDQHLKKGGALMGGLLVVALLLLIGMQVQKATEQEERMENLQASYQQEQEAQQQQMKQLTDSMAELRTYNQQLREREVATEARRQQVKDAIYQGKALIDKTMQQTRIDQHLDTLSNIIYIWGDFSYKSQSGLRAVEAYLEHINPSFDDTERDEIRNALNRHNEAIVTKWQNRIVNLYK